MKGSRGTVVPDVVGYGAVQACGAVRQAGLTPYGPEYSAEPAEGTVVRQYPEPHTAVARDAPVFLWTETGPEVVGDLVTDPATAREPEPV